MTNSAPDPHLSQTQLSEWALGEQSEAASLHVASCGVCRAKTAEFDEILSGFRASARKWSERGFPPGPAGSRRPVYKPVYRRPALWAATSAALVLLLLLLLAPRHRQHSLTPQEEAALLTQIDQAVSRTVPAAMDPLSSLVAGDGAPAGKVVR